MKLLNVAGAIAWDCIRLLEADPKFDPTADETNTGAAKACKDAWSKAAMNYIMGRSTTQPVKPVRRRVCPGALPPSAPAAVSGSVSGGIFDVPGTIPAPVISDIITSLDNGSPMSTGSFGAFLEQNFFSAVLVGPAPDGLPTSFRLPSGTVGSEANLGDMLIGLECNDEAMSGVGGV